MPSDRAEKEDEAKLDAAFAIAALSNGSWDPVGQQEPETNLYSLRAAAPNKRGGYRKSRTKINSSNGSQVGASVMPARAMNYAKRRRTGDVNVLSESEIPDSQAAAGDHLEGGKFLRSAKQTVLNSLTVPDGGWYRSPWHRPPESSFNVQSPLSSSELTVTNTDGGVPAEAKQTNGFLMTSLSPLFSPGSGLRLVPVTTAFGQSGDVGLSPLIADPHLLQLILQQGNFMTLVPNSQNPSPAVTVSSDSSLPDDVTAGAASPACPAQLPGSLSTLRNYYNMTNAFEQLAGGQAVTKTDTLSPSKVHVASQPTIARAYQITNDQFVKMHLASSDVAGLGSQSMLQMARGQHSTVSSGLSSASTLSNGTAPTTGDTDSGLIGMPGSLNILRSYYSSLEQKAKQNAPIRPSADLLADHIRTGHSQSSGDTLDSVLNLSKRDRNEITGIPGVKATDTVRPCLLPQEESTHLKETMNNGQCPSALYVPGSASTSSSLPLRILPKICESQSSNVASPVSSHLSDDQKRPDSVASSISSVHLPPKKRRKALSPDPIEMPLDNCCMVVGDEKVPLDVFLSRLDSRTHQIVINQIQSAIINQQTLTSASALDVSRKLPAVASGLNLSSAQLVSVPFLGMNVDGKETGNRMTFSIPSTVMSPNSRLLDVGVTHGKRNAQVRAKNGDGRTDLEESQSNDARSFQLPSFLSSSSSSLSQLSTPSSSEEMLNPLLQPDEDGDLPLHVAVAQGELRVVEQIVNRMSMLNATIDCRNYLRQTPLHIAVVTGNCEIVTCLLDAGASPNIADRNGQNCFHLAVQYKQVNCLEVLFSCTESRPDLLNYEGMTPLHLAVKLNLTDAVTTLLHNGVQPDAVDGKSGHTALYMAADTNRLRVAEILLSFGSSVQMASYSGCSPVQAASSKSFHEMVKLLVKHGGTSDPVLAERSSDSKDSGEFGTHNRKGKV